MPYVLSTSMRSPGIRRQQNQSLPGLSGERNSSTIVQHSHRGSKMSISAILSSAFSQAQPTNVATPTQKFFSQLASELQSGGTSSAQNDLSTLQQAVEGKAPSGSPSGSSATSHASSMRRAHNNHRSRTERFDSPGGNLVQGLDSDSPDLSASNIFQTLSSAVAPSASTSSASLFGSPSSVAGSYQSEPPTSSAPFSLLA